jgi:hypothetical protein
LRRETALGWAVLEKAYGWASSWASEWGSWWLLQCESACSSEPGKAYWLAFRSVVER